MIPDLNEVGYLPPGIHPATLEQISARFGQKQLESGPAVGDDS
jgi:hypothetical protein